MGSKKKKEHQPRGIGELERLFYDEDQFKNLKKYYDGTLAQVLADALEQEIPSLVEFKVEKIPELNNVQTPDFISEDRRITIEATSIAMGPVKNERIDQDEAQRWLLGSKKIDKINSAIEHALEKDLRSLSSMYGINDTIETYILFILVDFVIAHFFRFYDSLEEAVKSSRFGESHISALVFITEASGQVRRIAFIKKGQTVNLRQMTETHYV